MVVAPGTRLGPYEVLARLGAGGMGEVYRARDTRLKRDVAVKVLPEALSQHPDALARFEREALAVAALSHPGILSLFDVGEEGGVRYAVTELLEGRRWARSPRGARYRCDERSRSSISLPTRCPLPTRGGSSTGTSNRTTSS
jgi:serine/threonine protein kinase